MKKVAVILSALFIFLMFTSIYAQQAEKASQFKYVGVKKCKMCHNKAKTGKQFTTWKELRHSKAYTTLAGEEAKNVAKKAGVEGDPQKAKQCLPCHVTAFNAPADQKTETLTMEEGVSCEACHGPGSEYKSLKVKKDIKAGKAKGSDFGLIEPTKEVCVTCHNSKSPTFKEFNFEQAVKKITHPVVNLEAEAK